MRSLKTVLFLFFIACWSNAFAQPTFTLSQETIACGEQTCLQVSAQDFSNILSFQYSINWNAAILGNASVQNFGLSDLSDANFNLNSAGIARIGWDDATTSGITLADNTVLFELCFTEIGGSSTNAVVSFSDNPIPIEVVDAQGQILTAAFEAGGATVDCSTMDDNGIDDNTDNNTTTLNFTATQATANCGEQVCVDIIANGFTNVLSFQYSMNWDANLLGTATVQQFGLSDMDASQFNAATPGILRIGYDDSSLQGVNLPDNSILFQVCFDLAANATGASDVTFSASPIPIEVTDAQGNILTASFQPGSVTATCTTDNGGDNETSDGDGMTDNDDNGNTNTTSETLSFTIAQENADCGTQVCLDVSTDGFAAISSFQYALNWDAALLGTATVQQFGLPDMDASQFNTTTAGILRVGYDDSSLQGRTLPDGTVLFQLCFDVAADAIGTSDIIFSPTPIAIEAVDIQSNILDPNLQNGALTINCDNTTPPTDTTDDNTTPVIDNILPLGFVISKDTVNCGNQVCLDVRVQGFTDITFFRYSLSWDFRALGTQDIQQTNLENLRFGPIAPGSFWTEWRDPSGQGVTIADNDIIYTVCFDALGNQENATDVNFTNVPIPIQVQGAGGNNLRPALENGSVTITCFPEEEVVLDVADSLAFIMNNIAGNCGEQICLPVTVQDFNNILSFQYSINYNGTALGMATVQNFSLPGMSESNVNTTTEGIIRIGWDDANLTGVSVPDNQVLFDICFDATTTLSGGFEVAFSGTPLALEVVDATGNILTPTFQDGAITITCDDTPLEPIDTTTEVTGLQLSISDGTVNCGEQICLDVTAKNFTDILAFQYSINWDANVLGTATVQQFNLTGLGAGNFNTQTPGLIRVGWTDANVTGVTMAEDAVLYQICFDAIGNEAGNSRVRFSAIPLPIEILDGAGNLMEAQFQEGTVDVTCTVVDPPVDTTSQAIGDELTFVLSNTTGDCADQVCMDVTVHNFTDILTYQYSINWDANLLGQATVQGLNMPDLGAANFNANTPGVLRVGWDDSFITGVSLMDGQVIYQICFDKVVEPIDDLPISFSGNPTSIEVVDDQSNLINPTFVNGSLNMTCGETDNGGEPTENTDSELTFSLSQTTATCNEQMCADVRVKGFNNILSFQYSIIWDAATLGTANVQSFGIPDITSSNFNTNTSGILRVGWDDSFITGVTLPDDHLIFQVCFAATDESLENVALNFSGTPTSIEVVDRNGQLVPPMFQNGSMSVDCAPTNNVDVDNDGDGFTSIVDCDDNNPNINAHATEIPNNGIDEDCNGEDLITNVSVDNDGDGFTSDVDCDDNNPIIFPGATEFPNNNVDEDCDGIALFIDEDNDGFNSSIDCDDNNPNINGNATEIPNNGIDEDCNGEDLITNVPVDNDGDGFTSDNDCDDNNPNINPNATEIANNGIDEDCSGADLIEVIEIDNDNDGFTSDNDCDDNDPNINPNATEIANNGIDEDCSGADLVEVVEDGVTLALSTETATCGSQTCLNATVKNFTDLISFQYSLNWNPALLGNVTTQAYNLNGLNASAFFTPENGVMRISWFDTQVVGVSAEDDQTIFQICFDVLGTSNNTANIEFSSNPIPMEIVNNQSMEETVNAIDGTVNITNCSGTLVGETTMPTIANETDHPNQPTISQANFKNGYANPLENVQFYPNPTRGLFHINLTHSLSQKGTIRLYDTWGKLVSTYPITVNQTTFQLNLGNLTSGIYLIEIQEGAHLVRKRVVKQ